MGRVQEHSKTTQPHTFRRVANAPRHSRDGVADAFADAADCVADGTDDGGGAYHEGVSGQRWARKEEYNTVVFLVNIGLLRHAHFCSYVELKRE